MNKIKLLIIIFLCSFSFAQINNKLDESVLYLIDYLSTPEYSDLKSKNSDIQIVDSIYSKMLDYHNNDISETLLSLTFLFLPFKEMDITIPLLNMNFKAVLINETENNFSQKNALLPSKIFIDSGKQSSDIDKLAHFFGNAFISYNFNYFKISKILGIFVELFEESFKLQGKIDTRDLYANELGSFFGKALVKNKKLLPSDVLWLYNYRYFRIKI
ncbi:MAG: hypothetical protein PVH88_10130 [Ignavibacteria bacterium]|jgi:hypothetical protein